MLLAHRVSFNSDMIFTETVGKMDFYICFTALKLKEGKFVSEPGHCLLNSNVVFTLKVVLSSFVQSNKTAH